QDVSARRALGDGAARVQRVPAAEDRGLSVLIRPSFRGAGEAREPGIQHRIPRWIPDRRAARGVRNDGQRYYCNSVTWPSRSVTRRSMRAAMSMLWVAITAARPEARTSWVSAVNT